MVFLGLKDTRFLELSDDLSGEAAECQVWAEFGLRCGYLSEEEAQDFDRVYEQILAQLVTMIDHPENWTVGTNRRPGTSIGGKDE